MSWTAVAMACLWVVSWAFWASRYISARDGDELVGRAAKLLPAFVATSGIALWMAVPIRDPWVYLATRWLHHAGFIVLFAFLAAVEFMKLEAGWKRRAGASVPSIASTYRRLWILTELIPAPVALLILMTGLRMVWENPEGNSPSKMWLLGLTVGFSFFFWDGILGFQPIIRAAKTRWQIAGSSGSLPVLPGRFDEFWTGLQTFLHFLSFPFVLALGIFRWDPPSRVTKGVQLLEVRLGHSLPQGWLQVVIILLIWAGAGALLAVLRYSRRWFMRKHE